MPFNIEYHRTAQYVIVFYYHADRYVLPLRFFVSNNEFDTTYLTIHLAPSRTRKNKKKNIEYAIGKIPRLLCVRRIQVILSIRTQNGAARCYYNVCGIKSIFNLSSVNQTQVQRLLISTLLCYSDIIVQSQFNLLPVVILYKMKCFILSVNFISFRRLMMFYMYLCALDTHNFLTPKSVKLAIKRQKRLRMSNSASFRRDVQNK